MPLPPASSARERRHTRSIAFEGFKRADGLWDIEGHLVDVKDHDIQLRSLLRRGSEAIHDIHVRVTIDRDMNVVDVAASSDATPFMGTCENIIPDYRKIIGLNLFDGFRQAIKALYGDIHGCTHLNELLMAMPTAAYQTFAGETPQKEDDKKPFHLDRCHALSTDSEVVRRYYPRWYRGQTPE